MCLISLIAFKFAFGTHPIKDKPDGKKDFFSETLMYPKYDELMALNKVSIPKITDANREELTIKSKDGLTLKGDFIKCEQESNKTVILVHGYQSNGIRNNSGHALRFLANGFNVLLIDNRACGKSEGAYTTFGIKESEDLILWAKLIANKYPNNDIVLHGTSLGGATVSMASALDLPKEVKCIVSDCAFTCIKDEFKHLVTGLFHIPTWPILNCMEGWAKKLGGFDFDSRSPIKAVANAKVPMLFIHGIEDKFIVKECAQTLYDACPTEKDIMFVEGYGHAESQLAGDKYYNKVFEFINKYM